MINDSNIIFNPVFPSWIVLIIGLFAVYFAYVQNKNLQNSSRERLFFTLRVLAILILTIILLNPILNKKIREIERPTLALLVDQSQSIGIKNGTYSGYTDFENVIDLFKTIDTSKIDIQIYKIGSNTTPLDLRKKLELTERDTDLESAVKLLLESNKRIDQVYLLTDGNYTKGNNPLFDVMDSPFSLNTIALGDTTNIKDLSLISVLPPDKAYSSVPFKVPYVLHVSEVNLNTDVKITVNQNGKRIDSFSIQNEIRNGVINDTLLIESNDLGSQLFEISISEIDDEFTYENNKISFTTEIIPSKNKIAHISFGLHPDIKTIRSILSDIENIELSTHTWLKGNSFLDNNLTAIGDSVKTIIIQGARQAEIPTSIIKQLTSLSDQKNVLWLNLPSKEWVKRKTTNELGIAKLSRNTELDQIKFAFIDSTDQNTFINEIQNIDTELFPDLTGWRSSIALPVQNVKEIARRTIYGRFVNNPIIISAQNGVHKEIEWLFHDYYKWSQLGNDSKVWLNTFITNNLEWLSSSIENEQITFLQLRDRYFSNELFEAKVLVKDEIGNGIGKATVVYNLEKNKQVLINSNMSPVQNGIYSTTFQNLEEGIYNLNVIASYNGNEIGKKEAKFSISNRSNEFRTIKRNDQLLYNIAEITGGSSFIYNNLAEIKEHINTNVINEPKVKIRTSSVALIDYWIWVVLCSIFLGTEWLLRKIWNS